MASCIILGNKVIPYRPIEHRNTSIKKLYFTPTFYPKDVNSFNQARANLWQEACAYLSTTPKPNLVLKRVPLTNLNQVKKSGLRSIRLY